ncbi:ABC-type multidrug transport system, permease component [Thermus oshimai JL-2]|uniref:Transport permease protein n=1 Tax=Thermus oshimai JL-2 TaxID=751945 RepID=K7QWJ7_THEOS|nr:ABC transporter permease [Thermus oshimai]AFV77166.1 ABC-type multidrug transport system, permease component [Thermus oshimai JL-2]
MNRILALAEKELLEIRRDKVLPRLIVLLPTLMLLLFGYAINFTLTGIPLSVYDGSQDRISETLLGELTREDRFRVALRAATPEEVRESLDRGQARVGVVIPPGALERVRAGETVQLEIYLDGSDPNFAFQAQALLRRAVQEVNARVLMGRALSGEAVLPPLSPVLHTLYNPENKTAWFMIPGIIGLILTQFTVLLTALSIVREEESRMMEALLASPLRPHEVVLGKVLPYLGIAFSVALLVLLLGHWVFGVPVQGSLGVLLMGMFLFVLGSLAVGVLISTLARTQVQAVFGTFAYAFPTIFLSGFVFPIEGMPAFFRFLSYLVPARYLIETLRGVLLKGQGPGVLWPHLLALLLFSGLVLFLAAHRFRRQVAV